MTLHLMEPELEELLHEIARDPRSTLLRVDRPTILRGLFDRDPMVRESCTQLTSAERQLLRVHRSELAWNLRLICFEALDSQNDEQLCYCHDHGALPFPPQPDTARSLRLAQDLSSVDPSLRRRALVESAVHSSNPLQLAIAACRVSPSTAGYLLLSDAYQVRGESARDLDSLQRAHQLSTSQRDQAHIQSYLAFHHALNNRLLSSIDCYRLAYRISDAWPNEALSWLLLAARCTETNSFDDAARAIANTPIKPTTLTHWTAVQRVRRDRGHWSMTPAIRAFLATRKNIQSEQVLYVLDELFSTDL